MNLSQGPQALQTQSTESSRALLIREPPDPGPSRAHRMIFKEALAHRC